jgi:histidinol-phosphatase (PHP family)
MPAMLATYHNHTTWSDGKHTVADHLSWCARHNVGELGISDHLAVHPSGRDQPWAIPTAQLGAYHAALVELAAQQEQLGGTVLRVGVEADYYPGHEAAIAQMLGDFEWDYIIGSVHEVNGFTVDMSAAAWAKLDPARREDIHRQYWENMRGLAQCGLFDVVAHIDLPKKFGFLPQSDLSALIDGALDAIADASLVVEINTAGWHKPCRDAYPTLNILRGCVARNIAVTLSADAHRSEHLLRDFFAAAQRLRDAGGTRIARFAQRAVRHEPIDDAIAGLEADDDPHGLDDF